MLIREFLNSFFYPFDYEILKIIHEFTENGGSVFKPFIKLFDTFGNHGIGIIMVGVVLFFLLKNKKYSYMIAIALLFSVVINNLLIKKYVARLRPYLVGIDDFRIWWEYAGKLHKSGFSFMSGHTVRVVACFYSLYIENKNFRYLLFFIFITSMTIISRLYFVVHYPTDCLYAIILGLGIAYLTYYITTKFQNKFDYIAKEVFPFLFK